MEQSQRVLWHEGLFLSPQHFQQMDRHAEASWQGHLNLLHPFRYGLAECQLDEAALLNETVILSHAAGILPDGTAFALPDTAPTPQPRSLAGLLAVDRQRIRVHLALPQVREDSPLFPGPGRDEPGLRHTRRSVLVRDAASGGGQREIQVATPAFRLVVGDESLDGLTALPIADLVRAPGGGLTVALDRLPPLLSLSAAPSLIQRLRRLIEGLAARANELAANRRQRTQGMVEFSASESANYLLLHTLAGSIPVIQHLLDHPMTHPERMFVELLRLSGHLGVFSGKPASGLPSWNHDEPGPVFAAIEEHLRELLTANVITARYTAMPLTRGAGGIYTTRMPEVVAAGGHRIYLSIHSSAPAEKVSQQAPAKAKIAAADRLGSLIAQALKGLGITHQSVPPSEIPAQASCTYFELQCAGPEWDHAVSTGSLAVYLPPDFTDLRMEFMAVKE